MLHRIQTYHEELAVSARQSEAFYEAKVEQINSAIEALRTVQAEGKKFQLNDSTADEFFLAFFRAESELEYVRSKLTEQQNRYARIAYEHECEALSLEQDAEDASYEGAF